MSEASPAWEQTSGEERNVDNLDSIDKQLITLMQEEMPLTEHPFRDLGDKVGISEAECLTRVRGLKDKHIIRQIGVIFDSRNMGYKSSLVAMKADPDKCDQVAAVVSQHPGVSHNYKRNHEFNIWFTIAVPPGQSLEKHIEAMHKASGAISTRIMQTLRLYKIGVKLDLTEEGRKTENLTQKEKAPVWNKLLDQPAAISEEDIAYIRELQEDLELVEQPYVEMAKRLGVPFQRLAEKAKEMHERGLYRRNAAILNHRKAGFKSNGMGVWCVDEADVDRYGEMFGQYRVVSHCYRRPVYPDWKYNLFTMVHGADDDECRHIIDQMAKDSGLTDYSVLFSTTEYKKNRVVYFPKGETYPDWCKDALS